LKNFKVNQLLKKGKTEKARRTLDGLFLALKDYMTEEDVFDGLYVNIFMIKFLF
jgi:hypothetical protein